MKKQFPGQFLGTRSQSRWRGQGDGATPQWCCREEPFPSLDDGRFDHSFRNVKTIILQEPEQFIRTESDSPTEPAPGHALVRVHRMGICGTDLHAFRGRQPFFSYPRILGHELGVEVVQVGEGVEGLEQGTFCTIEPYLHCGQCQACRGGRLNCCSRLRVLGVHVDGGMREFIVVPGEKLHPSPLLTLDQLALVETLGIGAHAVQRAALDQEENVLVIGAGPIGLSVIQFARIAGARVMVMEVNDSRLKFCLERFGIDRGVDGKNEGRRQVEEFLGGELPTTVFDATGNAESMMSAFDYVAQGGRLVFVGLVQADITFHDPEFHRRELTLLSSRNSTRGDFLRIIRLLEEERIDTRAWITHRANFENVIEEFPTWLDPRTGVIKAMMEF